MKEKIQGIYQLSLALQCRTCNSEWVLDVDQLVERTEKIIIHWVPEDIISFKYFIH